MIFAQPPAFQDSLRAAVGDAYLMDETACVEMFLKEAAVDGATQSRIAGRARELVLKVRNRRRKTGGLDAFMAEYDLSSQEGVVLMCLAEALLRVPDADTADKLIRDKLAHAEWERHLGRSSSLFVNAGTWGLMLTGRLVELEEEAVRDIGGFLARLAARTGEPIVRLALKEAMGIMAHQFVMGRTIEEALERGAGNTERPYLYSYDILGEAAMTVADAERYFEAYAHAIETVGKRKKADTNVSHAPGLSVKLSALHPRFEFRQRQRVLRELAPRLSSLALKARDAGIGLTVDAEEADRLDVTLDVFEAVFTRPELGGWDGMGLAIQAYQKRAAPAIEWLAALARRHRRRIVLRLVKGAYWDTEIKRAQERGLDGYPVFTRKCSTDVSFLACARRLLEAPDAFYPQFASHNAYTVAVVEALAAGRPFEFQRLHGMGEELYAELGDAPCRVYAPVGSHEDLLPYLVRRLLENGANTSFVNRIADETAPVESLIADPVAAARGLARKPHPRIPLPSNLYGVERRNARGLNLNDPATLATLAEAMEAADRGTWKAAPLVGGETISGGTHREIHCPADRRRIVGHVEEADGDTVEKALAAAAAPAWDARSPGERARILRRAGDLIEAHRAELMTLIVREGGRCIPDALAEVREAVDYCRYYAGLAERGFAPQELPGPTGEANTLTLHGRGVFACISPWNFPLAIFTGQVVGALAAGNAVVAKPASQTPLVAMRAVQLLHEAGVPPDALHLLPGSGGIVGERLVADTRINGVVFTGSTETARRINRMLADRPGPIVPFIAETGGQNVMIVDSSALPEQVVQDVLDSAFNSAGQRCSALRVLFLQEDVAPRMLELLHGAMAELAIGDPALLSTDVGPVIDETAKAVLMEHIARMKREGKLVCEAARPKETEHGSFVPPCVFDIDSIMRLEREVFGPILHVVRYAADKLDGVIEAVNATGYGLTLGIHSRIESTAQYIRERARVGNVYVNRNMIGAVVGVQPFGGQGLSGTGPKAGGPHYLHRFANERMFTVNIAAVGGNATLLTLGDDTEA